MPFFSKGGFFGAPLFGPFFLSPWTDYAYFSDTFLDKWHSNFDIVTSIYQKTKRPHEEQIKKFWILTKSSTAKFFKDIFLYYEHFLSNFPKILTTSKKVSRENKNTGVGWWTLLKKISLQVMLVKTPRGVGFCFQFSAEAIPKQNPTPYFFSFSEFCSWLPIAQVWRDLSLMVRKYLFVLRFSSKYAE